MKQISVVIPTRDRPSALDACLAGLEAQTLSPERFEVVVVDDGGSAPVDEIVARKDDRLRISLSRRPHAGPAAARRSARSLRVILVGRAMSASERKIQGLSDAYH